MKISTAEGRLDARAMNGMLIDFMTSFIEIRADISEVHERMTTLEEGLGRLERRFPMEEVVTASNLPRDPHKPDERLGLIAALDVGLSPEGREDATHRRKAQ